MNKCWSNGPFYPGILTSDANDNVYIFHQRRGVGLLRFLLYFTVQRIYYFQHFLLMKYVFLSAITYATSDLRVAIEVKLLFYN